MFKYLFLLAILVVSQIFGARLLDDSRTDETGAFVKDDCVKLWQQGQQSCRAVSPVYTWDNNKQKCVQVTYGGCYKTRNNFKTLDDCKKTAAPLCAH